MQLNYKKIDANQQRGLSLVELMVSMAVGLFLLAGVVTNFIGTKSADVKRNALSEMDANASYAFSVLRNSISHAGYTSINPGVLESPFLRERDGAADNSVCRGGGEGNKLMWHSVIEKPTKDFNGRDQLTVVMLADNPCLPGRSSCANTVDRNPAALVYTDCVGGGDTADSRVVACSTDDERGMVSPNDAKLYSSFSLVRNRNSTKDRVFYCHGSRGGKQPIVENVEAIQYKYGVKNAQDKVRYRRADLVETADEWLNVSSVKVSLLMRSSNKNVLDVPSEKKEYDLLGEKVTVPSDQLRRLYKVYTTTINLENQNKAELR